MKSLSTLLSAALLAGCSGATTFDQFSFEDGQSARMDASQRLVLVSNRGGRDGNRHVVCAEPSPDSITSASAALSSSLQRDTFNPAGQKVSESSAEASLVMAQSAAFIGMRTQTIQLLRDGLYRACEAYMNGAIDETEYNMLLVNMPKVMTALIAIDGLTGRPAAPAVTMPAPLVTTSKPDGTEVMVQGAATITTDKEGKQVIIPTAMGVTPAAMPGDKQAENTAAAVYGIAQTIQQAQTMPAICLALLNNHGSDSYRTDSSHAILVDFCRKTLAADVARSRPVPVANMPRLPTTYPARTPPRP